jgi:hypothetical protein
MVPDKLSGKNTVRDYFLVHSLSGFDAEGHSWDELISTLHAGSADHKRRVAGEIQKARSKIRSGTLA